MSVWTLLTVSWHQDNLWWERQIFHDEPSLYRDGEEVWRSVWPHPGPGNSGKCQRNRHGGDDYERGGTILKLKTVAAHWQLSLPRWIFQTRGAWPQFPPFSVKLQDTIAAVRGGEVTGPLTESRRLGKLFSSARILGPQVIVSQNINQILDSDFISNSWIH